jgi:hypothetical protein
MGKYLDIIRKAEEAQAYDKNDINDQTHTVACDSPRSSQPTV